MIRNVWIGQTMRLLRRRALRPLTLGLVLVGVCPVVLTAQAPLERRAALHVEGLALEQALRELGRAAGVSLLYSPDLLPAGHIVTCACEDLTIRRALERILDGTGLTFVGSDRQIRIVPAEAPRSTVLAGVITGRIVGSAGERVAGAAVELVGGRQVLARPDGSFTLVGVRPGTYRLAVSAMGWARQVLEGVEVAAGDTLSLTVTLEREAIPLAEIRVTPGTFSALEDVVPTAMQAMSREEIQTMPQLAEDVFRSMKRLPGVAAHDISTRLHIRGGADREVLVRLDGMELFEPYHMKDWDGALGIVDLNALGGVELTAGGFGVESGDRMTGVFDMRSRTTVGPARTALGASISNLTAMSHGGFNGDRGSWLVSARRGFMGLVIRLIGEDERLDPQYWDVFGKVSYQLDNKNLVSAHVLYARDEFGVRDLDNLERAEVETGYHNRYGWVRWESSPFARVSSDLLVSTGRVTRKRSGVIENIGRPGMPHHISVTDDRAFDFIGLREELGIGLSDALLVKLGAEARWQEATFDYSALTKTELLSRDLVPTEVTDQNDIEVRNEGDKVGAWVALRARPITPVTVEAGLRYDRSTHSGDEDVSPRVLGAVDLGPRTTVRASWGRYVQSHGIHELEVGDGVVDYDPAERSRQTALGLEHRFDAGVTGRVELYQRTVSNQRPRFLNLEQELEVFPEAEGDRYRLDARRGRARGIEFLLSRDEGTRWAWSAAYALALAEDEVPQLASEDCTAGQGCTDRLWVPRRFDQRHAINLRASYRPSRRWSLSVGWTYHSGWPATEWTYHVEQLESGRAFWVRSFGPIRELRLPAYHRMDVRLNREFQVRGNPLYAYVDVFNLYDRTNLASYEFGGTFTNGSVMMERRDGQTLLPRLPTFGLRYEF